MRQSYIDHPEEIQELKDNVPYRFSTLVKRVKINRSTLDRERDNLQLPCSGPTTVPGWCFKAWANTPTAERGKFVKMKIYGRYWPQRKRRNPAEEKNKA